MFIIALLDLIDTEEHKDMFLRLYKRYKNLVMRISLERLNNDFQLAEDNTQEVFLKIAEHFDRIDNVESSRTRNFVCSIAVCTAISRYHKEKRYWSELAFGTTENDIDIKMYERFDMLELKQCIDCLDEFDRSLLYLTYIYGYNSKELGSMLNLKPEYIRKRNQLTMKKLRDMLEVGDE